MSRLIFLTGRPGIGKTSVLLQTKELLKAKGFTTGGMISRESRERGIRTGFEIVDLETGKKGRLAHVNQPTGPRVGKYRVNLGDLNTLGAGSILRAAEEADIIVIDEVVWIKATSLIESLPTDNTTSRRRSKDFEDIREFVRS